MKTGLRQLTSSVVLSTLLASELLSGEAPPEIPRVTGSAEVSLINVDVVVTGKDGKPVYGLSPSDFEVLHGKKPVTITNFREEKPSPKAVAPGAAAAAVAEPPRTAEEAVVPAPATPVVEEQVRPSRHIVVFIDYLSLPDPEERAEVFGAIKSLLRKSLGPTDEAMIVTWRREIRHVLPFTSRIEVLEQVLDIAAQAAARMGDEQGEIEKLIRDDSAYAWAAANYESRADSTLSRELDAMQVYADLKGKSNALKGIIGTMAGMTGRKSVVIVARRFARRAGAEFGTVIDGKSLIDSIIDAANAAGVTLNTMNANAWEHDGPGAAAGASLNTGGLAGYQMTWANEMESLAPMAEQTGGVVIGNTREAKVFADRVASDMDSWYSIGYPAPAGASKSAAVSVRVNRPGLTVRARRSIIQRSPEEQIGDRVIANLFRRDDQARIPITVSSKAAVASKKKGKFRTPIEIRIPIRNLVLLPTAKGMKGSFSVFVASAEPSGNFSEVIRQRRSFEIPAHEVEKARTSVFTYDAEVETTGPHARISLCVWDEPGQEAGFSLIRPPDTQ